MRKCIYIIVGFISVHVNAQTLCINDTIINQPLPSKAISDLKTVRINFHYISNNDGAENFTENSDGLGNTYNGYNYSLYLVKNMNLLYAENVKMNLPPGNTTPVYPKNIQFVLDKVLFHRNTNANSYSAIGAYVNTYKQNMDSVMNIFIVKSGPGGYASNISLTSLNKFIVTGLPYAKYVEKIGIGENPPIPEWMLWETFFHVNHELGHLLGLKHTVLWGGGGECPTSPPNLACDDDCLDTPNAWDMEALIGNHPNCGGWNWADKDTCTNNFMDYGGGASATPCQIDIMHSGLENGLISYTLCNAVSTDKTICDLNYPQISYYGKNITLGGCGSTVVTLTSGEYADIYFKESVEFNQVDFYANSSFEVIKASPCN